MKDKEKQIEEIAKLLDDKNASIVYWDYYNDDYNPSYKKELKNVASIIYNAGYRKITDSVVLSKEEYDTLKAENDKYIKDCIDYLATINKLENKVWEVEQQASKETAEKFAKRLIEIFANAMGVCSGCVLQHDKAKNLKERDFYLGEYKGFEIAVKEVDELAKQFGVEIKE